MRRCGPSSSKPEGFTRRSIVGRTLHNTCWRFIGRLGDEKRKAKVKRQKSKVKSASLQAGFPHCACSGSLLPFDLPLLSSPCAASAARGAEVGSARARRHAKDFHAAGG